jgi:hypothetical protein
VKIIRVGAILSAGFALAVVASGPAVAHAELTATNPASGAETKDLAEVSLTASEELLDLGDDTGFDFAVTDSAGHFYGDGCVIIDGATASMAVQLGAAGDYTVAYRGVSADGHAVDGSWSFTYSPAPTAVAGQAYLELPVCGQTQVPFDPNKLELNPTATTAIPIRAGDKQGTAFDFAPIIGIATTLVVGAAIWLLMRSLGKRDSEDHLS